MSDVFVQLPVPGNEDFVAAVAEKYFTQSLRIHYQSKQYLCFDEYGYAGGGSVYPKQGGMTHGDPVLAAILEILQGDDDVPGFKFPPKIKQGRLKNGGHQKPDFMAFRAHDGVVAEVGTERARGDKIKQLQGRVRDLNHLVESELQAQSFASEGRPLPWHGMRWRPTEYIPPGPVIIPVDEDHVVSTEPTYQYRDPGVYLYNFYRYERHQIEVGVPHALPEFSPQALREGEQIARKIPTGDSPQLIDKTVVLRNELIRVAQIVGVGMAVAGLAIGIILLLPELAAGSAVAGLAAMALAFLVKPKTGVPLV